MECNKDDAIKAREIAERKFNNKDIAGAKKFALKAQQLYPGLEGIAQMLVTLDVHASSENRIIGEVDWYGVLGVSPQADENAVRKQYRKLALILHPDKNKSFGAEGAFKLVSQAWSVLSDKSRRAAYDAQRNALSKPPTGGPSRASGANGPYNFPKTTPSHPNINTNKNVRQSNGSSNSSPSIKSNPSTFWTVCHRCRMQYEYLRTYLNQNLLCPSCRQPFFAIEQAPPDSKSSRPSKKSNSGQHDQNSRQNPKEDFQWIPFSGSAGSSSVAQAANVVQQTYEKVKRGREEAQAAKKRDKVLKRKNYFSENMCNSSTDKKQRVGEYTSMNNHLMGNKNEAFRFTSSAQSNTVGEFNNSGDPSRIGLHKLLMGKARKEIIDKLNGSKSASDYNGIAKKSQTIEAVGGLDESKGTTFTNNNLGDVWLSKVELSIPVPEPDFHDFDQYRIIRDFEEGQVWAVYDNIDGMPRYYALIHHIVSRDPCKLQIKWLSSISSTELCPINSEGFGFTKTCGDYRVGRHDTYDGVNCFSHKVRWTNGSCGAICIFPRKGDVWALYRNWSPDWDERTDDEVKLKYDMVEVLEDYDEELGVVVIPLVKVAGFKALFHHHIDPEQVKRIPNEEVCQFSHQIPSHLLSGQETPSALKGCRELDPAALPVEFLKVIDDGREGIEIHNVSAQEEVLFHDDTKSMNTVTETEEVEKGVA